MAIPEVSFSPLNPYPHAYPVPEVGAKAGALFRQTPELLPIPEPSPRGASALNVLPPVPAGADPGGVLSSTFNQSGGGADFPSLHQIAPLEPVQPRLDSTPIPAPQPSAQSVATSFNPQPTQTEFQVDLENALTPLGATPTAPTTESEIASTQAFAQAVDALPAMLQLVYRALVSAPLHSQGARSGQLPPWEHSQLYVEATNATAPMGERTSHHTFDPNQPTSHPRPAENLSQEALSAYGGDLLPAAEPVSKPVSEPISPDISEPPPTVDVVA